MNHRGFTLIELLIVIAIIAILALIAIPNFLEAQIRAKVSRVRADMRSVATGLEAYYIDYQVYPVKWHNTRAHYYFGWIGKDFQSTTPVAYLTSIHMIDPFIEPGVGDDAAPEKKTFHYMNRLGYVKWRIEEGNDANADWRKATPPHWFLVSQGPDRLKGPKINDSGVWDTWSGMDHFKRYASPNDWRLIVMLYDPTNGTVSGGDIIRWGP